MKNPPANPRWMQMSVARRAACAQPTVLMSVNAHALSATVLSSMSKTSTSLASMPIHPCLPETWWPVKKPAPAPRLAAISVAARATCGPRSGVDVVEREEHHGDLAGRDVDERRARHGKAEDADTLTDVMTRQTARHRTLCWRRSRWPSGSPSPRACDRDRRSAIEYWRGPGESCRRSAA